MNLYLIKQDKNSGWDTYDSAVVCAANEEEARNMDPYNGKAVDWTESVYLWAFKKEDVSVKFLGKAEKSIKRGVVCASYNAG